MITKGLRDQIPAQFPRMLPPGGNNSNKPIGISKDTSTRQSKSCDYCRQSKKKCDGKSPCSRCLQRTGKICTYSIVKGTSQIKEVDLKRIQLELSNLTMRRRYIEAYLEGGNPATYYCQGYISATSYENMISNGRKLQYNALLASATKAFGAPPQIYKRYEREAIELAPYLVTEFSVDAAVGFFFLAYYFWGEDKVEADHFHAIADSICDCARRKYFNNPSILALLSNLQIPYFALNSISQQQYEEELLSLNTLQQSQNTLPIPQITSNEDNDVQALIPIKQVPIVTWGFFNRLIEEKLLLFDYTSDKYDTVLDTFTFDVMEQRLDMYVLVTSILESPTRIVFAKEIHGILSALLHFVGGNHDEAFSRLNTTLDMLYCKDYLIGLGGPQFIFLLHSAFTIACKAGRYDIATRVSGIQRKQAEIYSRAREFMEFDMSVLKGASGKSSPKSIEKSYFDTEFTLQSTPKQYKISQTTQDSSSPFGWMTSVAIPVISAFPPES